MSSLTISAPGKLLIAGEYAVLEGSRALVAAVDRRIIVKRSERAEGEGALPKEIVRAFEILGEPHARLQIDRRALQRDGRKLGLGSSAAGAVAATALLLAERGEKIDGERVFPIAHRAHQSIAPRGSGVDVLASSYGGLLLVDPARLDRPDRLNPERALRGLSMSVIDTGASARTSEFLDAIESYRRDAPAATREAFKRLHRAMRDIEKGIERAPSAHAPSALLEALGEYGAAMRALGELMGIPIVEERLQAIDALARSFGGASKPSGAGGGDIALAFFGDPERKEAFEARASEAGFQAVALQVDRIGARIERA